MENQKSHQINALLDKIEQQHSVSIFLAVESGSRAWGFASRDSDYDIRFLYHHNVPWYVTAFDKKDNIELAMLQDLDASGWDIGKCMRLLYKGNATLHEWIQSPVIYRSDSTKFQLVKTLAERVFNPTPAFYHYISLAKKKLEDPETKSNAKWFLYGMRAVLCAQYIADHHTAPPILFAELVERYLDADRQKLVAKVLECKARGGEQDVSEIPEELWQYAQQCYRDLSQVSVAPKREGDSQIYDEVLHKILGLSH